MNDVPSRPLTAYVAAGVVASWPSAIASALVKHTILGGRGSGSVLIAGMLLSSVTAAAVGWFGWPSARKAPGLWGLYGLFVSFPIASIWGGLSRAMLPVARVSDVLTTSVLRCRRKLASDDLGWEILLLAR
jgi:hypothetical protein